MMAHSPAICSGKKKETKLAKDQDRVAGTGAGQQSGNQDVSTTQTGNGSVFSGRATQILHGQLSRSTKAFHFGGEPRHDEHSRTEEHRSIEVDDRQRISLTEPIFLA
jgi:hypothetical protein